CLPSELIPMRIRRLLIENFRAIDRLRLEDLADTVVVAGPNGCGKSQIYHAIRLLKSTYGGHQPNEYEQWWGEFQIRFDSDGHGILSVFRDKRRPVRLEAAVELAQDEIDFLRANAIELLRPKIWREITPSPGRVRTTDSFVRPAARSRRVYGEQVEQKT